jgi:sugar phosphate isomerase/epimerase
MPAPISVQLYSLRDQAKDGNHVAVLKKLADTGFYGVEAAGFYGLRPAEFRSIVTSLGMTVSASHGGLPKPEEFQQAIDTTRELGSAYYVVAWTPKDRWTSLESINQIADELEAARAAMAKAGVILCYHNHEFEIERIAAAGNKLATELLIARAPALNLEIDTYWAANWGKEDPAKVVGQFKNRAVHLHLKDGALDSTKRAMLPAGKGKQNFAEIVAAADPAVLKWVVVELDSCETDMTQAVTDSYAYLVGNGFALGKKPV